jgi:1-acyl-sn-glycerol-3-phosphate acyltransferase
MNTIPVDDKSVVRAIRDGSRALEQGLCVCVFPEGHVSESGNLQEPKHGVVFMAQKSGAPIYPMALKGNVRAFPRKARFPRPTKIEVEILDPVEVPRKASREETAEISHRIMVSIAAALGVSPPPRSSNTDKTANETS